MRHYEYDPLHGRRVMVEHPGLFEQRCEDLVRSQEDFEYEMRRFTCGDGMCGQLDCAKCYPNLLDKTEEEVNEEEIN